MVEEAIDMLTNQGYLNDSNYAKSYVNHQMIVSYKGPYKIIRELKEKKISDSVKELRKQLVEREAVLYSFDEYEKIRNKKKNVRGSKYC